MKNNYELGFSKRGGSKGRIQGKENDMCKDTEHEWE